MRRKIFRFKEFAIYFNHISVIGIENATRKR